MLAAWRRFRSEEDGVDLIEYSLLAAIIAVGISALLAEFILGVDGLLQTLIDTLTAYLS